jgi:branched-chain amino acid transport system substrate-binding protein
VAAFQKKYNRTPENHAWIEYIALKLVAQAMTEAKSTDTEKLIEFFEKGAEFDILKARKAYFRPWDHQLIQEGYPFSVKDNPADQYDLMVLGAAVPGANQPLETIYPTREQNPCSL